MHAGEGHLDSYLMYKLFPWLHKLHKSEELDIKMYHTLSEHGRPMIFGDPTDSTFQDTMQAICQSERTGFKYSAQETRTKYCILGRKCGL